MVKRETMLAPVDFKIRRKHFCQKIKGGVALLPSARERIRNHDVSFPFRQDSNFFYLTGFEEPHSVALFNPQSEKPFSLFVQPKDPAKELWEGKIAGPEIAKSRYGADQAYPSTPSGVFEELFVEALCEADRLYYRVGQEPERDQKIFTCMERAKRRLGRTGRGLWPILDPSEILGEMRLFKSKAEIERLKMAANISAEGHVAAMRLAKAGMFEYEVEATLFHAFRAGGAERVGYSSIVASGTNACTLHYIANNRRMTHHDLCLVDAGAEFQYYTADITRTFPISGSFTAEQREIYGAVLRVQKACCQIARPGKTMHEIHSSAVEMIVEELKQLKVLKGQSASLIKKREYLPFFPHGTGHWLGMDVHDAGHYYAGDDYSRHRKLEAGMVLTVEPGLYFGSESHSPARYKGIGVRIEDDVLITDKGNLVLTSGAPKEIDEVESLCGHA